MIALLLCALLVECALGLEVRLRYDRNYKGDDRYTVLDPTLYFKAPDPKWPKIIDPTMHTQLNGNPHYLRGIKKPTDSELFFTRVTLPRKDLVPLSARMDITRKDLRQGRITSFQILDLKSSHKAGRVSSNWSERIYQDSVTLLFESPNGEDLDYLVTVFGRLPLRY